MKRLSFILLLALCYHFSCTPVAPNPSTARIDISGGNITGKDLVVLLPLNGNNFWANRKTIPFDSAGNLTITLNKEECGLVLLRYDDGFISRVIVAPGDQVKVHIMPDMQGRPQIAFEGTNAAGHQFFNSLDRPFILDVNNPYRHDSDVTIIKHKIQSKMELELSALKGLLAKGEINKSYDTLAELDIRYYYAASFADAMNSKFYYSAIVPKENNTLPLFKQLYGEAWEQAFGVMPLQSRKALATEYFKDYAQIYYEWYLGKYAPDKSKLPPSNTADMPGSPKSKDLHTLNYAIIDSNFKDSTAEYLKAVYLYYTMARNTYEQSLLTIYTRFRKQYPKSRYLRFLKPGAEKILVFQKTKDADFTSEQQFLPGYENINSLAALRKALKNGPYYVDIWATWCGPCKGEFKFNESLSAMLREYNVKPLYLSIDKDKDDEDWKNMIKYYKLPGLHLRASDNLRKDITKQLGKNNSFSIPRYLIINKKGSIVNSDAERPSSLDDLKKQINKL